MSIASVAWNAMHLYGLAGCSHNACKLPKKLLTPENDRRKSSATTTLRANSALVYNYVTTSVPPCSKPLYLWTQTLCHPSLWMSALPGCSVPWHRWWRWGACRWGRSSGSSDLPRCCCCRGRWSAEWGRGPLVAPRSAGSPTLHVALWSDLPSGVRWEDGAHLTGRWFCMRCMCGRGSEMKQRNPR